MYHKIKSYRFIQFVYIYRCNSREEIPGIEEKWCKFYTFLMLYTIAYLNKF